MKVEIPVVTYDHWQPKDRYFGEPMPEMDMDFETRFVGDLFRRHRTFPAFLPGVGDNPDNATSSFVVPENLEWVAVNEHTAVSREDFQAAVEQVRVGDERAIESSFEFFNTSLYDITYWLSMAMRYESPAVVIGWSIVDVPTKGVPLASIKADPDMRLDVDESRRGMRE